MLSSSCTFSPEIFERVMLNLIKNPNIMSTHLFRADIFYDSEHDVSVSTVPSSEHFSNITKHLKPEYQPVRVKIPEGWEWQRTYVRQLVPRNPQLDRHLVQTCHFWSRRAQYENTCHSLVLYIPHLDSPDEMPWYHPTVPSLAFLHQWSNSAPLSKTSTTAANGNADDEAKATVSIHFSLFPSYPLDTRLERTALQLLRTLHKHGQGQAAGYVKRVHHDLVVPQQRFQDTYSRLKAKYAKQIIADWVEVTDPGKHVFEDLGIASFLIELWRDMYSFPEQQQQQRCEKRPAEADGEGQEDAAKGEKEGKKNTPPPFPGFVDIGCGNGLLVHILLSEGYPGWGFDARRRKTWFVFPPHIRSQLHEMVLVPHILQQNSGTKDAADLAQQRAFHDGRFKPGTFIVSNHADELTPWTPLLGYLNRSPWIAIPCCSHSLAGARFRAPSASKLENHRQSASATSTSPTVQPAPTSNPQNASSPLTNGADSEPAKHEVKEHQAAETGSLKRPQGGKKMPSAYATLCDYVASLARVMGFEPEKEMLRIPSTRNACILGRGLVGRTSSQGSNNAEADGNAGSSQQWASDGASSQAIAKIGLDQTVQDLDSPSVNEGVVTEETVEYREEKDEKVRRLLEVELDMSMHAICEDWIKRAKQIAVKKSEGH